MQANPSETCIYFFLKRVQPVNTGQPKCTNDKRLRADFKGKLFIKSLASFFKVSKLAKC